MKKHIKKLTDKTKRVGRKIARRPEPVEEVIPNSAVPRITNETIAEHREEVLKGARKYIYPLQHSKHRIVVISSAIFIVLAIVFATYCTLALYKFQNTSTFIYRVTQVIPFPIAHSKAGFVSYESYLFELRHYIHYYETQQKQDFTKQQLNNYKKQALQMVIDDAYIKQLARQNNVKVTNQEVDAQIDLVRSQNRLGTSDKVLADVLNEFWGWSINDFKRSLRDQLLAQKVVNVLDKDSHARANAALAELQGGADFAATAAKYSDDAATKGNGGAFGAAIDKSNRELTAATTDALYKLQPGQISGIINVGYGLEIVKNEGKEGDKVKGAHILIQFKPVSAYLDPLKKQEPSKEFVKL